MGGPSSTTYLKGSPRVPLLGGRSPVCPLPLLRGREEEAAVAVREKPVLRVPRELRLV